MNGRKWKLSSLLLSNAGLVMDDAGKNKQNKVSTKMNATTYNLVQLNQNWENFVLTTWKKS